MDHQRIITITKEVLLSTGTLPTAFFVERQGVPLRDMDTFSREGCGDATPPQLCLFLGRQEALERRWDLRDIRETAYTSIEKQGSKEYLVVAFCTRCVTPPPTFTLHRIEIRRGATGSMALIDTGACLSEEHRLLMYFTTGIMTSALSLEEIMKQLTQ